MGDRFSECVVGRGRNIKLGCLGGLLMPLKLCAPVSVELGPSLRGLAGCEKNCTRSSREGVEDLSPRSSEACIESMCRVVIRLTGGSDGVFCCDVRWCQSWYVGLVAGERWC